MSTARAGGSLHRPAGTLASGDLSLELTPEGAGWAYCGLRVLTLAPGAARPLVTGNEEFAVLPLSGSLTVEIGVASEGAGAHAGEGGGGAHAGEGGGGPHAGDGDAPAGGGGGGVHPGEGDNVASAGGRRFELAGRASVFDAVTDWCYLPIGTSALLSSAGGCVVALPSARATRRFEPVRVPAADVPVELRGAGPATRQLNNFMSPQVFAGADKLMCVEVLTPDGNWSSYPPHRHDDSPECPVNNEEIYYFRIEAAAGSAAGGLAAAGGATGGEGSGSEGSGSEGSGASEGGTNAVRGAAGAGFALHRTYTPGGAIDERAVVADGDVFVIPRGYHGPTVAAPGYPLYYLNVLAGPGDERSMAFCDDPTHAWVRDAWTGMPLDPRCPMTSAGGRVTPATR